MTQSNDPTITLVQTLIAEAKRLGLVWTLRPATAISGDAETLVVRMDGDGTTDNITAVNMLGQSVINGARVMALMVPPSGLFVIGYTSRNPGYRFLTQVRYTVNDSFVKGDHPGVIAIRVSAVGGGGGGGGCAASGAGACAVAGGAGAGGYAESFILASALNTSENIIVGTGGAGGVAGNNVGTSGVDSSFGTTPIVIAEAGGGGNGGASSAAAGFGGAGGPGGAGTGDFILTGSSGWSGVRQAGGFAAQQGDGGFSHLSTYARDSTNIGATGATGRPYGGGGGGGYDLNGTATARAGGVGADGIVIVDIFV